jgi:hypothetical protein
MTPKSSSAYTEGIAPRRIAGEQVAIGSAGKLGIPLRNRYPVACLAQATLYDDIAPLVCDEKDLNNKEDHEGPSPRGGTD